MNQRPPKLPTKVYHRAKLIREDGAVSALCSKTPKPIDLSRELWTIIDGAVTCPKCIKIISDSQKFVLTELA